VELGYRYEGSPIICPDGTPEPPTESITYAQTARPGSRAPHAWIDGHDRSTLDEFGQGFVLMSWGASKEAEAIAEAARQRGLPLRVVQGSRETAPLYEYKLVMVRPDGHVAWRADTAPANSLDMVDRLRGA
jgi:hypothetical protein